ERSGFGVTEPGVVEGQAPGGDREPTHPRGATRVHALEKPAQHRVVDPTGEGHGRRGEEASERVGAAGKPRRDHADARHHDTHQAARRKSSVTFWPPKPNEFDIAADSDASRAVRGTQSNGTSGSGTVRCTVGGTISLVSASTVASASRLPA